MQCTRRRKTKSDVNTAHGDECVLSAMTESMRITSMRVMEKDDYQHVIRKKRIQVALMQPTADKSQKFEQQMHSKGCGLVALIVSQTSLGINGIAVKRKPTLLCDIQTNERWASNQGAKKAETTYVVIMYNKKECMTRQ